MAKNSEYGGDETIKSQGIQPLQSDDALKVGEQLRLLYATDPADEASLPDRYSEPAYLSYDNRQS